MKKILLKLRVVQEKELKNALNKKYYKRRLNPYNPLTYIIVLFALIIGVICFGFVGIKQQMSGKNEFKWH